jgi:acyl-CoA hydrolase
VDAVSPGLLRYYGVLMPQREREITLRFLAEPTDVNFGGKVHGGAVMKWIDQAGYACAVGWSGQYCVTVYVGAIRFYKPVLIGNVVEVSAKLVYTGRTSMHVAVEVSAGDPKEARYVKTTHCVIVFVALDDQGAPAEIERWRPETEEDAALEQYAKSIMGLRKGIEEEETRLRKAMLL